jgi:predicted RNase H-like nuclease
VKAVALPGTDAASADAPEGDPAARSVRVVGVDGIPSGWAGVELVDGTLSSARAFARLSDLLDAYPDAVVVAVDIPIGLPETGPREADVAAKFFLKPRHSSVFLVPPRTVLEAHSYDDALQRCAQLGRPGISQQAYALRGKILEVDELARPGDRLYEVHPEVSFQAMKGAALSHGKKSWNGFAERRRLLNAAGIELPHDPLDLADASVDDVLDAAAAAWSARRIARGEARTLPEHEVVDERGRRIAIWY